MVANNKGEIKKKEPQENEINMEVPDKPISTMKYIEGSKSK